MAGNSNTNAYWIDQSKLSDIDGIMVNFKNTDLLKKYHLDNNFKELLIQHITHEIVTYVNRKYPELEEFLRSV